MEGSIGSDGSSSTADFPAASERPCGGVDRESGENEGSSSGSSSNSMTSSSRSSMTSNSCSSSGIIISNNSTGRNCSSAACGSDSRTGSSSSNGTSCSSRSGAACSSISGVSYCSSSGASYCSSSGTARSSSSGAACSSSSGASHCSSIGTAGSSSSGASDCSGSGTAYNSSSFAGGNGNNQDEYRRRSSCGLLSDDGRDGGGSCFFSFLPPNFFPGLACILGIYVFFMSFAFVQEKIYRLGTKEGGGGGREGGIDVSMPISSIADSSSNFNNSTPDPFTFSIFLVFIMCVSNAVISYLYLLLLAPPPLPPQTSSSSSSCTSIPPLPPLSWFSASPSISQPSASSIFPSTAPAEAACSREASSPAESPSTPIPRIITNLTTAATTPVTPYGNGVSEDFSDSSITSTSLRVFSSPSCRSVTHSAGSDAIKATARTTRSFSSSSLWSFISIPFRGFQSCNDIIAPKPNPSSLPHSSSSSPASSSPSSSSSPPTSSSASSSPIFPQRSTYLLREVILTSLSYVVAMLATNYALTHVSYPTQVLVKSAKMVPVVVGGFLVFGRTYPWYDYVSVVFVTAAIATFNFLGTTKKISSSPIQAALATGSFAVGAISGAGVGGGDGGRMCPWDAAFSVLVEMCQISPVDCADVSSDESLDHYCWHSDPGTTSLSLPSLPPVHSSSSIPSLPSSAPSLPSASTNTWGLLLLGLSLLCDGLTGPRLDKINSRFRRITSVQVMLFVNSFAICTSGVAMVIFEQLEPFRYCLKHPQTIPYVGVFCLSATLGQFCIFYGLRLFGSLHLTFITTTRKFFTVVMSVLWFEHHLSTVQWMCMLMVFCALTVQNVFSKKKKKGTTAAAVAAAEKEEAPKEGGFGSCDKTAATN